jgi:hypothetical protein
MISETDLLKHTQIMHLSFEKNDTFACLKSMHRISLLLLFIIFLALGTSAQQSSEIGFSGGGSYYLGELNPGTPFKYTKPAYGLFYRRNLNSRLALQLHGFRGTLKGADGSSSYFPDRNLNFETKVTEIATQFEVNFYEYFIGSQRNKLTPYIFGGAGIFMFKPTGMINGVKSELKPLGTEGQGSAGGPKQYKLAQVCFPMGIGAKYSLGQYIGLGLEWGMRKTTTDYIDDISTSYFWDLAGKTQADVSPAQLASDPSLSHNAGMQRGNSKNKDWYSFAMISISFKFRFFEKEKCLEQNNYRTPKNKSPRN